MQQGGVASAFFGEEVPAADPPADLALRGLVLLTQFREIAAGASLFAHEFGRNGGAFAEVAPAPLTAARKRALKANAAELMPVGKTLTEARVATLRLNALATAIDSGATPRLAPTPDVPGGRFAAGQALASSQFEALQVKRHNLQAPTAQRRAELRTTRDAIEPMAGSARISKARAEDYGRMVEGKHVGRHDYLLREQERIAAERDLATQRNRLQEIGSALIAAEEELSVLVAGFRRQTLEQLREAEQKVAQGTPELAKAGRRDGLMTLRAPVDGTVQQLAVHAVGEDEK